MPPTTRCSAAGGAACGDAGPARVCGAYGAPGAWPSDAAAAGTNWRPSPALTPCGRTALGRRAPKRSQHLDDLLLRRTRLGLLLPRGGEDYFAAIGQLCQPRLGWDDEHWQQELQRYRALWQRHHGLPDAAH